MPAGAINMPWDIDVFVQHSRYASNHFQINDLIDDDHLLVGHRGAPGYNSPNRCGA
jgi:hypothetical protein